MLPGSDTAFLNERSLRHTTTVEAGLLCVVVPNWRLPPGYSVQEADLLLRLPAGYPDVPPDMWWFDPAVVRADGQQIPATNVNERHLGRDWQRWSRHLRLDQWRSGIDGLGSFFTLIREELLRSAQANGT